MSLAAIKRRIQVGTAIQIVRHDYPPIIFPHMSPALVEQKTAKFQSSFQVRTVAIAQTNAIAFDMPDGQKSWLYWPRASQVRSTPGGFEVTQEQDGTFAKVISYEWR